MKAAVLYGKEDIRVGEVKMPRLQPGEVRIAIEATLTCGTDLKAFKRSLTLVASFYHTPRTIRRALELIERGVIRADDFVDGQWALSQLPELFRSMAVGNRAVKTFIRVSE